MNIFGQTVSAIFALALLAALGMGGYFAFEYIAALFLSMDAQMAKVTAVAAVVVLLAATIIASSIRQAGKQNMASEIHASKAETYKQFVDTWGRQLRERMGSVKESTIGASDALQVLEQQLALYGSPAVIKAHNVLRALAAEGSTQYPEIMRQLSNLLMEIRKDLGSSTSGLKPDEICRLVLDSQSNDL